MHCGADLTRAAPWTAETLPIFIYPLHRMVMWRVFMGLLAHLQNRICWMLGFCGQSYKWGLRLPCASAEGRCLKLKS